jgi:hypothetical protein
VVVAGLALAVVTFVFGLLKSSEPYKEGLARAQRDPAVVAALGVPVEAGIFPSGSINVSGDAGEASLSIPISGPDGSGTIDVNATKSGGTWSYSRLQVRLDGGQVVDLSD